MKTGNVSFGIKYDYKTYNVLVKAKLNGLNTDRLEKNLADLRMTDPEKVLFTEHEFQNPDEIHSMYIANSRADDAKEYIVEPYYHYHRSRFPLSISKIEVTRPLDQSLIDEITKNLQEYKKMVLPNVYSSDKNEAKNSLIEKLGKPIKI